MTYVLALVHPLSATYPVAEARQTERLMRMKAAVTVVHADVDAWLSKVVVLVLGLSPSLLSELR